MPLYEYKKNAENYIDIPGNYTDKIYYGRESFNDGMVSIIENTDAGLILLDGWYGVNWDDFMITLKNKFLSKVEFINAATLFKSTEDIEDYRKPFVTDDPSFGWVNDKGVMEDVMDEEKIERLKEKALKDKGKIILYGPGSAIKPLADIAKLIFYFDFTMQPLLWQMWDGKLVTFGNDKPEMDYNWKKYYYNDFYLLLRQKKFVFSKMDYYVECVDSSNPKLIDVKTYNYMIDELVKQPIKQVKITQPGPWGAYRYRDLWDIEGLECNAWNELAGIELSVLISWGEGKMINIPAQNFMQRPLDIVGSYVHKTYPDLLPLQVWLDDGYFPTPVPFERSSMPIHNHPSSQYVKEHFNEPLGRYETYYIVESYKNSSTWMGFKEDADLEEWERLCRESDNKKEIPNWQDFISRWDTNVGDLFLIPPGTTHGHGGNQMILEMDTGPSVAGTEYSFFTFDFARNTWDDVKKEMTAPPMRMHLKHSFDNNKFVRENRVKDVHRARPITVDGNGKFRKDRYTTIGEMPFHIERIFFEHQAENDTEGKYMQIATLTEGKNIIIRSKKNPKYFTKIERLQACIIPASFGEHEYINEDGSHAMVVIIRLKQG
ncbi:MAG: hypothetical protein BWY08_01073 [Bacteroidetes bacterium ADurb.Bin174]|nr:MAG: hypothetical protein BWY08_01073 [Bacteroidetes bacterium ADurb.Bin174]